MQIHLIFQIACTHKQRTVYCCYAISSVFQYISFSIMYWLKLTYHLRHQKRTRILKYKTGRSSFAPKRSHLTQTCWIIIEVFLLRESRKTINCAEPEPPSYDRRKLHDSSPLHQYLRTDCAKKTNYRTSRAYQCRHRQSRRRVSMVRGPTDCCVSYIISYLK